MNRTNASLYDGKTSASTTPYDGTTLRATIDQMERVMREIGSVPTNNEWILIGPDGKVWKGSVQHLFMVLASHHPQLKIEWQTKIEGQL